MEVSRLANGRRATGEPGGLNALEHIVVKAADVRQQGLESDRYRPAKDLRGILSEGIAAMQPAEVAASVR